MTGQMPETNETARCCDSRFHWHRLRAWRMRLTLVFFTVWLVLVFTVPYEHNVLLSVLVYAVWAVAMVFGMISVKRER